MVSTAGRAPAKPHTQGETAVHRISAPAAIGRRSGTGCGEGSFIRDSDETFMEVVWERARASVREVMDVLNDVGDRRRAYTTYMTIMARLARKHLLERERSGKTDYYRPVYTRPGRASPSLWSCRCWPGR